MGERGLQVAVAARRYDRGSWGTRSGCHAAVLAALLGLSVCGCGAASLDATNVDTFERTFGAMIEPLPEGEREALAEAVLVILAGAGSERLLLRGLPHKRDVNGLLDPRIRHDYVREVVRTVGAAIHGKDASELRAMAAVVVAQAQHNQALADRERAEERRARLRERIGTLQDRLPALQAEVEAAARAEGARREEVRRELAALEGLEGSVEGQAPEYEGGYLWADARVTFANGTDLVVHDVRYGFEWTYGECAGRRYMLADPRMFRSPLQPDASRSIERRLGVGWVPTNVQDDASGRDCPVAGADDFRVTGVMVTGATVDDGTPRLVDVLAMERELERLEAAVATRRQRVASVAADIEALEAELAAL